MSEHTDVRDYNHMVHVRYSIFDPGCCACVGCEGECQRSFRPEEGLHNLQDVADEFGVDLSGEEDSNV